MANERRFAMAAAVALRGDYDAATLRGLARSAGDPGQVRRLLLALAAIYAGSSRSEAALGGVGLQTVRDWVLRFNAEGPAGLETGKAPGNRPILGERERAALRRVVEEGPTPAIHGVVRWRIVDLMQWLWEEFRLSVSKQTMSRELRALGFRKLSARPRHHAKDEAAAAAFKKLCRDCGADRDPRGSRQADRDLVPGRGQDRAEEQDHPPLGPSRHAAHSPARPADLLGLYLRRHLPGRGQGRRPRPATLHHGRHGLARHST